jgi:hypothetical protein
MYHFRRSFATAARFRRAVEEWGWWRAFTKIQLLGALSRALGGTPGREITATGSASAT